jgi:CubicO group peptidase (beta-lactamase class C family)
MSFEHTMTRLAEQLDDGLLTRGVQIAVEIAGERVLDVAMGDNGMGDRMTVENVFRVYCTIKPVTALGIATLVERKRVGLDDPLELFLPDFEILAGGVTLRHVLTHTAGLHQPVAAAMEMVPPDKRRAVVARVMRRPGWRPGRDAAYSDFTGWHVLGWLIEAITGEDLRAYLRKTVLDPLGLRHTRIGMTTDEYRHVLPTLGVNTDMRNLGGFPMLFERSERVCTETNPAHGGYASARDLARFYSQLLKYIDAGNSDVLPCGSVLRRFCAPARPTTYDEVLDRECSYGLGFMTDLKQHAFGDRCSPSSFGHSGNVGSSFAFADPPHSLAIGVVFNGIVGHEAAFLRRRVTINALYRDLESELSSSNNNFCDVRTRRTGFLRGRGPR